MSAFYVTLAESCDDAEICRLLRQRPMGQLMRISLERAPNPSVAALVEGYRHNTVLVRDKSDQRIVGMGSRSVRKVFYNGEICRLGYLSQLRAAEGRHGLKRLAAGYEGIRAIRKKAELPFDLTSIVDDNLPARRLLQKGLRHLPVYRPLVNLSTFILPAKRGRAPACASVATPQDLEQIVALLNAYNHRFQFAPVYTEKLLLCRARSPNLDTENFIVIREAEKIVACAALWDQRPFKQAVVQSYGSWLKLTRPALNLGRRCLGKPLYPHAPYVLPMAFLSHFAMPMLNETHLRALIQKAQQLALQNGIQYLAVGFAERHPCHDLIANGFGHQRYGSVLYSVHWRDQPAVPENELNHKIPHPEVALL